MATLKVEVVAIEDVIPHDNADRLDVVLIKGWEVVVSKGSFKQGDLAVYFPVDSVLPEWLESQLFPPDSKIKLNKRRIRSIRIRGRMSQGLLITCNEPILRARNITKFELGDDLTEALDVVKYEPPVPEYQKQFQRNVKKGGTAQINPFFEKYTNIENIKNHPDTFKDGELVYISEKLHGTSARYGCVPRHYTHTIAGRLRKLWDMFWSKLVNGSEPYDYVYGSRNVQLQTGANKSWYAEDVYTKIGELLDFKNILKPGECVYGEIVGDKIQKNYHYGCGPGEHKFFAYDVMVNGRWLNYHEFVEFCDDRGIPRVPELYIGPYSKAVELKHRDGDSAIGGQKIREGVVIKPLFECHIPGATYRKVLKSISDAYYLEDNSDYH